jgi:hypothetical protein
LGRRGKNAEGTESAEEEEEEEEERKKVCGLDWGNPEREDEFSISLLSSSSAFSVPSAFKSS